MCMHCLLPHCSDFECGDSIFKVSWFNEQSPADRQESLRSHSHSGVEGASDADLCQGQDKGDQFGEHLGGDI